MFRGIFFAALVAAVFCAGTADAASRKKKMKKEDEKEVAVFPKSAREGEIRKWIKENNRTEIELQEKGPFFLNVQWHKHLPEPCHAYPWILSQAGEEIDEEKWREWFRTLASDKYGVVKKVLKPEKGQGKMEKRNLKLDFLIGKPVGKDKNRRGYELLPAKDGKYCIAYYFLSPTEQEVKVNFHVEQDKKAQHKVMFYPCLKEGKGLDEKKMKKLKEIEAKPGINCILAYVETRAIAH